MGLIIYYIALLIGFYYDYGKGKPFQAFLRFMLKTIFAFVLWGIGLIIGMKLLGFWMAVLIPILLFAYIGWIKVFQKRDQA